MIEKNMILDNHAAMISKLFRACRTPIPRLLFCGLALLTLSACSQAIQPWVQPEHSQDLRQLKIDNYLMKQELAMYRKKLMQANLENRRLAEKLQNGGHVLAGNLPQPAQQQIRGNVSSAIQASPAKSPQPGLSPVVPAKKVIESPATEPKQAEPKQASSAPAAATRAALKTGSKQAPQSWTMKLRLFFDSGHKRITPAMQGKIDELAKTLSSTAKVRVAGYSDSEPVGGYKGKPRPSEHRPSDNKELSRIRATAVVRALIAAGIDHSRIQVGAFGTAHPIASNETAEGRAKNRRVEILVNE